MKHTLLFIIALLTISCDNIISSPERPKTAQELRQELKSKEEQTPSLYLQEEGVVLKPKRKIVKKATFFKQAKYADDGALITGQIINKATLAKYKDVVVDVSFYSQTKTQIDKKSYVLYEYYEPNSTNNFSLRIETPKAMESFDLQIRDAKVVY